MILFNERDETLHMRTPENIARHELIGLKVKVASSSNPGIVGTSGRVIDESRNTLTIERTGGSEMKLLKEQCVLSFYLPEQTKWVDVDGKVILARPEDRIKKRLDRW
jgi:ribonuclease P protein subunit POP4